MSNRNNLNKAKSSRTFDPNKTAKYLLAALILFVICAVSCGLSVFVAAGSFMGFLLMCCAIPCSCSTAIFTLIYGVYVGIRDRERPQLWSKSTE